MTPHDWTMLTYGNLGVRERHRVASGLRTAAEGPDGITTNYYKVPNKILSKRDTLLLAIENARDICLETRLFI